MYHIGILQLTQNLDDAVNGFKQGLSELGLEIEYHYFNADGNTAILPRLASDLAQLNVDIIFACSTPSAVHALQAAQNIPVVFTPVFDPVGAGLVKSLAKPGGNITGTAGMVNAAEKVKFIQELLPEATSIGILYASEDANAVLEAANFAKAAPDTWKITQLPIERAEELSCLPDFLPKTLDALFLPIGKIIEDNFATIVYYTDIAALPIIASHAPNVPFGALGALTANHNKLGKNCALQAFHILKGTPAGEIPVDIVTQPDILLNASTAKYLSIKIPENLLKTAHEIYE